MCGNFSNSQIKIYIIIEYRNDHLESSLCKTFFHLLHTKRLLLWEHILYEVNRIFFPWRWIYIYIYIYIYIHIYTQRIQGWSSSILTISCSHTSYRLRQQPRPGSGIPRQPPWQLFAMYLPPPSGKFSNALSSALTNKKDFIPPPSYMWLPIGLAGILAREIIVQSQVESFQRLKIWFLMLLSLIVRIIW